MKWSIKLVVVLSMATLVGCGGGSTDSSSNASGESTVETANQRINKALFSGDVSGLQTIDMTTLLDRAIIEATNQRDAKRNIITSIYGDGRDVKDVSISLGTSSSANIGIQASTTASSLIVSDSGNSLAAVAQYGNGRGLAYGADVLQWMAGTSKEQQHYPLFLRAFKWLMTGDGNSSLPSTIKFATAGYNVTHVKNFISRTGSVPEAVDCAVADSSNTCWTKADVIVFGGSTPSSDELTALVQKYLSAGKAVIYMHPNWTQSAGGIQVLSAMGMTLGGYPGNYFASTAGVSVSSDRTITESITATDKLSKLITSLQLLKSENPNVDLATDTSSVTPFATMLNEFSALNSANINIFYGDSRYLLHRLLVLWADMQRPSISYGNISRSDTANFLKTYASDSFQWFARSTTTTATAGQGDFMPAAAQHLATSADWEEIKVTIPQVSGVTLIGRAAVPAKAVQIEIVDDAGATGLGVQTNNLRTWGNPLTDSSDKYAHPMRPQSFTVKLNKGVNHFVTPNGGPLMLNYSGATEGTVVRLRVKGSAKYAHYDFTQDISNTELAEASASLQSKTFGWNTFKFVGGEIQQTTAMAISAIGNKTPNEYIEQVKTVIFDSNHIANGYNNMPLDNSTQQYCNTLGWDCTGTLHRAPGVQHFVGWIATCGFLCSGNPVDAYTGVDTGWGWVHELGHNTVQNVLTMTFPSTADNKTTIGCGTECNNNILAGLSMLRKYSIYASDNNGSNFNHPILYSYIQVNRTTGLSGEALRQDMEARLWQGSDNAKQAFHMQLAHLYTRLHLGKSKPDIQGVFEFMRLLNISQRLYNNIDLATASTTEKNKLGLGGYKSKDLTRPDLIYVLSSKIMGYDLKQLFTLYGLPVTDNAKASIALLGLADAPLYFYAQPSGKSNHLDQGLWLTIPATGTVSAYPY